MHDELVRLVHDSAVPREVVDVYHAVTMDRNIEGLGVHRDDTHKNS